MANMKTIGMLLIVAVILVAVAVVIRQQSTAPPKPSAPGYYEGPMKGKGGGGSVGAGQ